MCRWCLVFGVWCLAFATQTSAAPAPFRRPAKPAPTVHVEPGRYKMTWAGSEWDAILDCGGRYEGHLGECHLWRGTWRYDRATRTLRVEESCGDGWSMSWDVVLDGKLAGSTSGGTPVALARR